MSRDGSSCQSHTYFQRGNAKTFIANHSSFNRLIVDIPAAIKFSGTSKVALELSNRSNKQIIPLIKMDHFQYNQNRFESQTYIEERATMTKRNVGERVLKRLLKRFKKEAPPGCKDTFFEMMEENSLGDDESNASDDDSIETDDEVALAWKTTGARTRNGRSGEGKDLNSGLEFENQGFDDGENLDGDDESTNPSKDEEPITEVVFEGVTFRIGECFDLEKYKKVQRVTVGIKSFVNEETAHCVRIVPFQETILGTLTSPPKGWERLQVPRRWDEINLKYLLGAKRLKYPLPSMGYTPKQGAKFAYSDSTPKSIAYKRDGPLNCIDLFCGAGGASEGLKRSGFHVIMGVEIVREAACAFYENHGGRIPALHEFCLKSLNHTETNDQFYTDFFKACRENMTWLKTYIELGGTAVFLGKVGKFLKDWDNKPELKEALQVNGDIHHVHLSPPCQGFSGAKRDPHPNDKARNKLSLTMVAVAKKIRPLTISFENVVGIWRRQFLEQFVIPIYLGLHRNGYQFRQFTNKACEFGDPQVRNRFFIVASLKHMELPRVPPTTHCHPNRDGNPGDPDRLVIRTAEDAIGCFEGEFQEVNYPLTGDPQYDLTADKPTPAIRASKPPKHYSENRMLNWQESGLLAFDPSFCLYGDDRQKQRQAGNAIPTEQATALFRVIEEVHRYEYDVDVPPRRATESDSEDGQNIVESDESDVNEEGQNSEDSDDIDVEDEEEDDRDMDTSDGDSGGL